MRSLLFIKRAIAGLAVIGITCGASVAFAQGEPPPSQPPADEPPPPEDPIPPAYTQTEGQPPPDAGPPPGYGPPRRPPPPGYGPPDPYNYGVPYGTPPVYDPDDWEEGDPIPPGYREDTRIRKGLVIGGSVTLGSLWVISIIFGAAGASIEQTDEDLNGDTNGITPEDWYVLMVPVAGPFIGIATLEPEGAGTAFLILDGVAQAGGLAMLIAGLAARETYIRPVPYGEIDVRVAPVVAPGFAGMGLNGTF